MLLIVVLWFGISAPLSAVGAYYGTKHGVRGYYICVFYSLIIMARRFVTQYGLIKSLVRFHQVLDICDLG